MAVSELLTVALSPVAAVAATLEAGALYLHSEAQGHQKLVKVECFVAIQDTLPDDKKQDDTALQARNHLIDSMFP